MSDTVLEMARKWAAEPSRQMPELKAMVAKALEEARAEGYAAAREQAARKQAARKCDAMYEAGSDFASAGDRIRAMQDGEGT